MSSNADKQREGDVLSGASSGPIAEKPTEKHTPSDDEIIDEDEGKQNLSQHSPNDESDEETEKQPADKDLNKNPTARSPSEIEQDEKQKEDESKPAAADGSDQEKQSKKQLKKQSKKQSDQPSDSKPDEHAAEMDYDKYDDKMLAELMRRNSTTNTVFEMKNKLESSNFEVWRELFEARMRGVHLFQLIDPDQGWEETETKTSQWRHLDCLARDVLKMNVDEGIRSYIRGEPTARAMYLKVIEQFQGSTVIRGWRLCKDLCDMLINKRDQLDQIAVSFNAVSGKLTQLFPTIPAMFLTSLYCAVLPAKYDYILSDVLQASEGKDIDYKEIVKLTMAAHSRNMESSNSNKKYLSSIGAIGKVDDDQSDQNQTNEKPKNSNRRRRNKKSKNTNLFCDYCKRTNHDDTYCFFKSKDVLSGKIQIDQPVNSNAGNAGNQKAKTQQANREQFIAAYQLAVCGSEPSELDPLEWYLDSCAGVSVANSLRGLVGMLCKMEARLLDYENRESRVQGVGTYHLVTETGAAIKLTNVIYKASSAASYLSLGQLMKTKLFRLAGEDDWLELYSKATGELVLRAIRMANSNTYKIQLKPHPETIDRSSAIETDGDDMRVAAIRISPTVPVELKYRYWHCVLCHCSFGYLVKIAHLLGIDEKLRTRLVCDVCTMTKAAKLGFSRSEFHAAAPFDLVHADLSGIVRVANVESVSYFLLLIDDFSRYISVFLLGRKYQVADSYAEYLKYLDVQFGAKVKCLRTDNGTEFKNERMNELTIGLGTARQYSAHGNPQQNGRAERPMRTIAEMARAILKQKGLSMRFWPYAILYAVYLKNRLPHSALDFDIPFHKLFGKLPELKDIIQFGVLVFVLDLERHGKLADRARPAIFLGYPEETKGFYVYLIDERKVDITRDIYTSEQVFGSPVKTETTYSVDPNDADISMDPEHPLFDKPLFEEERETIEDQVREQLESSVVLEEDLDEYSTADYPNNSFCSVSDASFYSASSESPEAMLVRDELEQGDQQVNESEQSGPARATEVAITERPPNESENASQTESSNADHLNSETPADSPAEAAIANDQPENEKAKPPFLGDLIDTKEEQHGDYPRGAIVMNKTERNWFKRVFPDSTFVSQVPYKAKGKGNHKLQVVNVAAIQAPRSYDKAMSGPHRPVFQPAMDKEMAAQIAAGSFELVERPKNVKILPTVWLYRYQHDSAGQIIGGKARLVVLGNQQTYQIGENNYAPVVNMSALRTTLAIAASRGMHTHHIDCKTAFLNSEVDGVLYAAQPKGYIRAGEEHLVWRIRKSIYGLRQSARRWYLHLRRTLLGLGFRQSLSDSCIFVRGSGPSKLIVPCWVDDLLAICSDENVLRKFKIQFAKKIKITDHGEISSFLGIRCKFDRVNRTLEMDQQVYLEEMLKQAKFDLCGTSKLPLRSADIKKLEQADELKDTDDFKDCLPDDRDWYQFGVGKLMYVANTYRVDLAFPVSILSSHMHSPKKIHLTMLKQLLRYVQQTKALKLIYKNGNAHLHSDSDLIVYADSSFEESISRVGILAFVAGNLVSWTSRKQNRVATSTAESEVLAIHDAVNEIEFIRNLIEELDYPELISAPTTVCNDNLSAKCSSETGGKFDKNKAYRNRLNRIIRAIEDQIVEIEYTSTANMLADGLTKTIPGHLFKQHLERAGLIEKN